MGVTKQYLSYEQTAMLSVVASRDCHATFTPLPSSASYSPHPTSADRYVATGACQRVHVWDTLTGELAMVLSADDPDLTEVTCVAVSECRLLLAAGHADGSVCVFSLTSGDLRVKLKGHRAGVTCLTFNSQGMNLVSGSKDSDIIVWDVVSECGLYRLRGHKGAVTQVRFLNTATATATDTASDTATDTAAASANCLVSSGKDSLVKFWQLDSQHCFKTLVAHLSEVWEFVLCEHNGRLITGSGDNELRVFQLQFSPTTASQQQQQQDGGACKVNDPDEPPSRRRRLNSDDAHLGALDDNDEDDDCSMLECRHVGSILRQGGGRVCGVSLSRDGRVLCCHGSDRQLELFYINSNDELRRRLARRAKNKQKRARESGGDGDKKAEDESAVAECATLQDEIRRLPSIVTPAKLKSACVSVNEATHTVKVVVVLANNSVLVYSGDLACASVRPSSVVCACVARVHLPGHRSDVRAVDFSPDGAVIVSASSDQLKMWSCESGRCVGTVACAAALCVRVVAGGRHALLGSSSGQLQLIELASAQLLEDVAAHSGQLWGLDVAADGKSFATAGADKQVKFWSFELVSVDGRQQLSFVHTRTHDLDDECLCVKFSPDGRLVAVGLLDCTVKIFFTDSLKLFLTLYGHRLPVLCLDISYDSTLIVTGSGDKNVKIWGLDFGDCHKSLFAHDDTITGVRFIGRTHQFVSCAKDGRIKHWDADVFERVLTLVGHCRDVLALAVSADGSCVASASRDQSVRVWRRGEEPVVLCEQRELERQRADDQLTATTAAQAVTAVVGEHDSSVARPGIRNADSERAAERIMEALQVYRQCAHESGGRADASSGEVHPLMTAYNCTDPALFVVEILRRVKASELDEALLVLPFDESMHLLRVLLRVSSGGGGVCGHVELVCRCACRLLRLHHGRLLSSGQLATQLAQLRHALAAQLDTITDICGFNLAGLRVMQSEMSASERVMMFVEATQRARKRRRRKQKQQQSAVQEAAIIAL